MDAYFVFPLANNHIKDHLFFAL